MSESRGWPDCTSQTDDKALPLAKPEERGPEQAPRATRARNDRQALELGGRATHRNRNVFMIRPAQKSLARRCLRESERAPPPTQAI